LFENVGIVEMLLKIYHSFYWNFRKKVLSLAFKTQTTFTQRRTFPKGFPQGSSIKRRKIKL